MINQLGLRLESKLDDLCNKNQLHNVETFNNTVKQALDYDSETSITRTFSDIVKSNSITPIGNGETSSKAQRIADDTSVRIKGIPESSGESIDRLESDKNTVHRILKHIGVDCAILDIRRLGNPVDKNKKPKTTRPILVKLDHEYRRRVVLLSLAKLKTFDEFLVSIGPDLSPEQLKQEQKCLQERWELIQSGTDKKCIRIRNLKLQLKNAETEKWEDKLPIVQHTESH